MNWPMVSLGDVAEIQGGIQKQPKRSPQRNAFPFLRVANVTAQGLKLEEIHAIELFDGELERYRLRRGDLLVVEGNGSASQIGRAAVWDGSIKDAVHQNHLIRVRPGCLLNERFLGLVWNSPSNRAELARIASSTSGLHTLSVTKLKRIMLPLPPSDEQRRIVDLLEDHLSRLDAAQSYLKSAESRESVLYGRLLDAALMKVATVTVPFASTLKSGLSNGRSVPTQTGGFPVLRLTALREGRVDLNARKEGAWTQSDASRFLVERGDFLISRGNGSLRLVGLGGLVTDEPDPVAFPDTLIRARPDRGQLDPEYLALVWNSTTVRRQVEASAKTTAGIYKVNQKDLGAVSIPMTSLAEQATVVARVRESRDALAAVTEARIRALTRLSALRRSLLATAFSGRLTAAKSGLSLTDDRTFDEWERRVIE